MIRIKLPKKKVKVKKTPGGAGVIAIGMGGKILLGKRSRNITEPGQWGLPGGSLEPGERFVDAAIREFKEEAGYEGEYRIVDSVTFERSDKIFKLFVLVLPYMTPGLMKNQETETFIWEAVEDLPERDPKHWILEKLIRSGFVDPIKVEEYVNMVGQEEKYFT